MVVKTTLPACYPKDRPCFEHSPAENWPCIRPCVREFDESGNSRTVRISSLLALFELPLLGRFGWNGTPESIETRRETMLLAYARLQREALLRPTQICPPI